MATTSQPATAEPNPQPAPVSPRPDRARPELLAPAGDWDCARAAIENGADAIYFGLDRFNARMRANNFTEADLPPLMEFLHRRGVRGYVTLNTLVFEDELAGAEQYLRTMITAGVDAVIVQDVGICRLIRRLSPDFPIHASTQMTITSAVGVEFARELGCQLVVLARELSIPEIDQIQSSLRAPDSPLPTPPSPLPLEVFVHGALCVAYSGQCLTSEALGGRSANRGECAQACRMPYELISDGRLVPLGDRRYLLSPQDLAGLELLPELTRVGVASLKIEGRLKSPEYVANITRIYRQGIDALGTGGAERGIPPETSTPRSALRVARYEMEMAFSRGLYTGWFGGINNQELVHARFGKKRGVYLGQVTAVGRDRVRVRLEGPLKPGDGVVFDAGHPEEPEEGGRVFEVRSAQPAVRSGESELTFGNNAIDFSRVRVGDRLWKTSDPALDRQWRHSFEGDSPKFQRPLLIAVHGVAGQPLTLIARDELGHVARTQSSMALSPAEKQALTTERLRDQLGRLGGTPFRLGELDNQLAGNLMLPVSELNRLRRELVAELDRQRAQPKRWTLNSSPATHPSSALHESGLALTPSLSPGERVPDSAGEGMRAVHGPNARPISGLEASHEPGARPHPLPLPRGESARRAGEGMRERFMTREQEQKQRGVSTEPAAPELIVLVRNLAQLETALRCGAQIVYCDFENPKKYRDAVARFRTWELAAQGCGEPSAGSALPAPRSALYVAPPRIFKPGEEWQLEQVRSCQPDGYLVRNYDHLRFFAGQRCIGDFSLNVANHLSAGYFIERFGLERLTASYDLNIQQLEALLRGAPPEWFEITLHQHMPMFHMEHCVFCAFLSSGKDYRDCGRPCDSHDLKLRDRVGAEHPVKADVGCRNTVFNARAQTGAEYVDRLLALGARRFRVEFLNETPAEVERTLVHYRRLLRGEISGTQLWRELKLFNQLGVTRGTVKR